MKQLTKFTVAVLLFSQFASLAGASEASSQRYVDLVSMYPGPFVQICETDGEKLAVAEFCGRFWQREERVRSDLLAVLTEFNGFKNSDLASYTFVREKKTKTALVWVGFIFENGTATVYEGYSTWGPYSGPAKVTIPLAALSRQVPAFNDWKVGDEICPQAQLTINYSFRDEKQIEIRPGQILVVKNLFANGYGNLGFKNALPGNFSRYGSQGNNLHVDLTSGKFEKCQP